jgi:hypothetical protein
MTCLEKRLKGRSCDHADARREANAVSVLEERACPGATDLLDYGEGQLAQPDSARVEQHVAHCKVCSRVLDNLRDAAGIEPLDQAGEMLNVSLPDDAQRLVTERSKHFRTLMNLALPEAPSFGQLWTTKSRVDDQNGDSPDRDVSLRVVVVLWAKSAPKTSHESHVIVAPISLDIAYRSSYDLVVFEQESALGYSFMVEVWNEVSMLEAQLGRYLGALRQPAKRLLGLLYQAHLGAQVDLSELADRLGPGIRELTDPRVQFQEQEIEACEYLRRPLLQLVERYGEAVTERTLPAQNRPFFLHALPVKHGVVPRLKALRNETMPLAAAMKQPETALHFIHAAEANEELLGVLFRDFPNHTLCVEWQRLPSHLEGKHVRIWTYTGTGETYNVECQLVRQGELTCLVQEARITPSQIESVRLEIVSG